MGIQTIDIDETVTLADQTIANFQHVPEAYAETDLLQDLYTNINFMLPMSRDIFSAYFIGIFLIDVVFEGLLMAFPEIVGTNLDQVGHSSLQIDVSVRVIYE